MGDPSRPPPPVTGYPVPQNGHPPPPGSAYAYQAPPPNPYYYQSGFYQTNQQRVLFLRRCFAAMAIVMIIFFIIFFICWLVIRPKPPEFHVTSFSLSNFNVSSSQKVTGNWNTRLQVYNPNKKMKIYYDVILAMVYYKSAYLTETRIPPFDQDTKNQTVVDAALSVSDLYVDSWVVNDIGGDRSKGTVPFNFKIRATVGFKVGRFRARRRILTAYCDNLGVGVSSNSGSGNLTGGTKQCRVYL